MTVPADRAAPALIVGITGFTVLTKKCKKQTIRKRGKMTIYKVVMEAFHNCAGIKCILNFYSPAETGHVAIDNVMKSYDLSALTVLQTIAKEHTGSEAVCVGITEII